MTRHLVRRVIIPIVVVASVITASNRVLSSAKIPAAAYSSCMTHLLTANDTPADVMFIGSSRTGAAIDATLLSTELGGRRVDKFVYTADGEFDRDLAIRTYLRQVGAPRVLAIESLFWIYPNKRIQRRVNEFEATPRTMSSFGPLVYTQAVTSLLRSGDIPFTDMFVRTRTLSPIRYAFGRIDLGWDLATRNPRMTLDPPDSCPWKPERDPEVVRFINGRKFYWIDGKSEPFTPDDAIVQPKADRAKWADIVRRASPFDLTNPFTARELAVVRDIVRTAKRAGVEHVVLYYAPQYAAAPKTLDVDALRRALPGVTVFDSRPVINDPKRPLLREQFFNAYHLNRYGAHELTLAMGRPLRRLLGVTPGG